jgi:hypothetical protein
VAEHYYRSGLRFRPPLAHGGHAFTMIDKGCDTADLLAGPVRPSFWRCVNCSWTGPIWAITERFYPKPCMGHVARLAPADENTRRDP